MNQTVCSSSFEFRHLRTDFNESSKYLDHKTYPHLTAVREVHSIQAFSIPHWYYRLSTAMWYHLQPIWQVMRLDRSDQLLFLLRHLKYVEEHQLMIYRGTAMDCWSECLHLWKHPCLLSWHHRYFSKLLTIYSICFLLPCSWHCQFRWRSHQFDLTGLKLAS